LETGALAEFGGTRFALTDDQKVPPGSFAMLIRSLRLPRSRRCHAARRSSVSAVLAQSLSLETLEGRLLLTGQTVGLMQYDMAQAFDGYNLLAPSASTTTYLLDMEGRVVHTWDSGFRTNSNYLLEDGSLLRTAQLPSTSQTMNAPGAAGRIERISWDGELIWYFELNEASGQDGDFRLHHDIEVLPNGNILAIAWERLTTQTALDQGRDPGLFDDTDRGIWPDAIIEIQPDLEAGFGGEIVWSWHVRDHLIQDVDPGKANFGVVADHPKLIDFNDVSTGIGAGNPVPDWNHFNSVQYDPEFDQIVISSREQNEIWVIDHSTTTEEAASDSGGNSGKGGRLLYRWGNPEAYGRGTRDDQQLFFQHDAQVIDEGLNGAGNILIFNNGWDRQDGSNFSEAVEIVPPRIDTQFHLAQLMDGSMGDVVSFGTYPAPDHWQPIAGDWDGDGTDSTGGFNPLTGTFYLNDANADGREVVTEWVSPLSGAGLLAIAGDWNGDGTDTVGVFDPARATFTLFNTTNGSGAISLTLDNAGAGALVPLAGDWNGDGFDSIGIYDSTDTGFRYTNTVVVTDVAAWSSLNRDDVDAAWQPVVGDWDGDGSDSIGWYDPSAATLRYGDDVGSAVEVLSTYVATGVGAEWRPIVGDWNDNGSSTLGLYDPDYGDYEIGMDGTYGPATPVWTYSEGPDGSFFSPIVSSVQRLPNGNTLIGEGGTGRAFEVTPAGDIVWEYVNPVDAGDNVVHQGDEPGFLPGFLGERLGVRSSIFFRFKRYAPDFAGFDGRDLTPGGVLERTDPNVVVAVDVTGNLTISDIIAGGSANTIALTFDSMSSEFVVTSPRHDLGDGVNLSTNEIRVPAAMVTGQILVDLGARNDVFDASTIGVSVNVLGGDGDDAITGGMADDMIDGGAGDDMLAGLGGDDLLAGSEGNDSIRGAGGRDLIDGGAGDDILRGQGGHDEIRGGAGIDRIEGGSGTTAVEDEVAGNVVVDAAGFRSDRGDVADVVARSYLLTGSALADRIDASASPIGVVIDGADGNDILIGSEFDDALAGGNGNDIVDGLGGDDLLAGDEGDDVIRGGSGNDRMIGNGGNDTLLGGDGNDVLIGGSSDDVLLGEAGDDRVRGNGGVDLVSGAGNGTTLEGDVVMADMMDSIDDAFVFDFDMLLV
jgi:Ca2+-binding RTX toxin-like protein